MQSGQHCVLKYSADDSTGPKFYWFHYLWASLSLWIIPSQYPKQLCDKILSRKKATKVDKEKAKPAPRRPLCAQCVLCVIVLFLHLSFPIFVQAVKLVLPCVPQVEIIQDLNPLLGLRLPKSYNKWQISHLPHFIQTNTRVPVGS